MKKTLLVLIAVAAVLCLTGCASTKVDRVSADTVTDLSGYWNDTDVRIVAESLVADCVDAPAISNYIKTNQKFPVVILGTFRNDSDEHIDLDIVAKKFETALINSGKVDFVASADQRAEIREERIEQQEWASEETAKRLANETAADFMLIGSVKTIVDAAGNKSTRTYYVNVELIDVETNRKLWIGENSEIKKVITRSGTRG